MKKLTSKHGSEVRKPAALRVIFYLTLSVLSYILFPSTTLFKNLRFDDRLCWPYVLWTSLATISVNQRSVDNAHLEIVELCPASHRPLLTKVVHVWLDLATIREVWVRRSGYVLYNREPIRPKSSQDFMNGTTTGQSSNGQSQHAHKGAVLVCGPLCGDVQWRTGGTSVSLV